VGVLVCVGVLVGGREAGIATEAIEWERGERRQLGRRHTVISESNVNPSITQCSFLPTETGSSLSRGVIVFTRPECHSGILEKSRSC
jgi:hypothetical protein